MEIIAMYDLIILGGGPAGYRAAEIAGENNLKTLLIEKHALGGVCLNEGCIPSKTLLHSAKIYDYARGYGEKYGVHAENATLDHAFVIARKDKIVKTLVSGISASLKSRKVEVVYGEGKILAKGGQGFKVTANGTEYEGLKLLICAGSEALMPPIEGLKKAYEDGIALTNREILGLNKLPKSLCVIGGGVIGLEMASYFNSAGAEVSVVEMLDKIAGPTDSDISKLLLDAYKAKGVVFHTGAKVTSLEGGTVNFDKAGEKGCVKAEKVLVSIGRRAVTKGYGLETLGVLTERGAIVTDEQMKTNIPGVFAAGDVNGKSMLAHTAYREAEVAVNTMLGKKDYMDYSVVPSVIYTNPEAASVGETEETAKAKGLDFIVKKLPMNYSGRYMAENEGGRGICKLLFMRGGMKLIGVSMLANPSSEIIVAAAAMLGKEMRASDIQKIVFPHPTVGEVIREGAF
jgi:dihydrolipoamide dehydrogenase